MQSKALSAAASTFSFFLFFLSAEERLVAACSNNEALLDEFQCQLAAALQDVDGVTNKGSRETVEQSVMGY